ncbi:CoA-binding protein [Poritiphilus flavus]|uniref:CoA-binding protein n=1 Tax=Poritiphilus flavus TaxID=2697053 RepID=A0A6L9EBA7_9FLAO|nr:CoA-binding protein [Poritiphilus flavus]NAS11872.1 CoA-binding protein [Poritiphilus flavus]
MKKTLVFGASTQPNRYSNLAIHRLVAKGIETVAFGRMAGEVLNVQIKTNLEDFQNIHTLTLYMNPYNQRTFYDAILDLAPKRVIFNPGTENFHFYELLREKDIEVEVGCTLVMLATGQY